MRERGEGMERVLERKCATKSKRAVEEWKDAYRLTLRKKRKQ